MRKLFSFFGMLMLCATLVAQTPSAFKYQAVARSQSGTIMAGQEMSVRISILKGAQVEYSEVHSVTTNELGLFNIEVGRGSPVAGTFFDITWNQDPHFMRVEVDPAGGTNFMFLGISELLSVPYAQHAETVTNNDDADADPDNEIQDLKVVGDFLRITNHPSPTQIDLSQFNTDSQQMSYDVDQQLLTLENGGVVDLSSLEEDADANPTNELQTVTQVGSTVTLSQGGGSFNIDDADANPTNELQTLSQSGNTISLSQGGGSVTFVEHDGNPTNEIQDLSFNNNYIYITNKPNPTVINLNHLLDNTDEQNVHFDSVTANLSIDNGNVINLSSLEDDADADVTNELQTISRQGNDLVLSHNGGIVSVDDGDSDDSNEIQTISMSGLTVTLSQGGGSFSVADDDSSPVNEIQDLMVIGDSLFITNNQSATAINLGNTDNQTLTYSPLTYELTIANGNTIDLTNLKDDDDANPLNEIQDLYLSNDSLIISDNQWATVIDLGPYKDNTDHQTLTWSNDSIIISNGNGIDLSSYLDNTDAQQLQLVGSTLAIDDGNAVSLDTFMQDLSIVGNNLSISGGNTIAIPSSADNLGNHTATQVLRMGTNYISNDGDAEGLRIGSTGQVNTSGNFFVGEDAGNNMHIYLGGRVYDWDDQTFYVDPNFRSRITDLRVDSAIAVTKGGITVSAGGMSITGTAAMVNNATVGGTFGVTGAATLASTLAVTGNVTAPAYVSTVSTGTAPMTVSSTTLVSNLNADLLDGLSSADFMSASATANGDVTGALSNLEIAAGVVGTTELADASVNSNKLASDLTLAGTTTSGRIVLNGTYKMEASGNPNVIDLGSNGASRLYDVEVASNLLVSEGTISIKDAAKAFYFGEETTDGSWRIIRDGNDLVFERREGGSWVTKTTMIP